jgi:hypothetical protein
MSAGKRRAFRIAVIVAWLVWALIVVGSALAQDGTDPVTGESTGPDDLDTVATRLTPFWSGRR